MAGNESEAEDLGLKMQSLLDELREEGLNGIYFPYAATDVSSNTDYALAFSFYPDVDSDYFNYDECRQDFVDLVKERFEKPGFVLEIDGFNNVEVYREGYTGENE